MKLEVLEKDKVYHIYNRGINSEVIFNSDENKRYFLKLYSKQSRLDFCLKSKRFRSVIEQKFMSESQTKSFELSVLNKLDHFIYKKYM